MMTGKRDTARAERTEKTRQRTLLIVDDDSDILELLRGFFEREEFRVVTAENGLEGIERAREIMPDLILLNYLMPVMDGFRACRVLKKTPYTRHIPVIIFSACAGEETIAEAFRLGAEEYITSPFSAREMLAQVNSVLERRAAARVPR
ncbi:MAG: response regulator [Acidobacteria bacterium]|nr:response regulator [Acidobacteriota bacterium]